MEGRLGCGDPGWLSLPVVPPQLHLWDLGAYGGPSGPWGSRVTVPASHSSSTPSLGSGGLWRAPPPFAGMLQPLRALQGTTAAQEGQWVGGHVERGDAPKDVYHFFV